MAWTGPARSSRPSVGSRPAGRDRRRPHRPHERLHQLGAKCLAGGPRPPCRGPRAHDPRPVARAPGPRPGARRGPDRRGSASGPPGVESPSALPRWCGASSSARTGSGSAPGAVSSVAACAWPASGCAATTVGEGEAGAPSTGAFPSAMTRMARSFSKTSTVGYPRTTSRTAASTDATVNTRVMRPGSSPSTVTATPVRAPSVWRTSAGRASRTSTCRPPRSGEDLDRAVDSPLSHRWGRERAEGLGRPLGGVGEAQCQDRHQPSRHRRQMAAEFARPPDPRSVVLCVHRARTWARAVPFAGKSHFARQIDMIGRRGLDPGCGRATG